MRLGLGVAGVLMLAAAFALRDVPGIALPLAVVGLLAIVAPIRRRP